MKKPSHTLRRSNSAFTLIEVMLAISIAAIGIIAILGLLPGAIQSGRDAADNTLSATIAQDIFSNIRSQPLSAVDFGDGSGPIHNVTNSGTLTFYYDSTGNPTNVGAAYYKILFSSQQQATLPLWNLQVAIIWPALAKIATTNTFISNLTSYDQ